jgi:protein ImuA
MSTTLDKHRALEALRQRLPFSGSLKSQNGPLPPVKKGRLDAGLSASGLHEIFGETPADIVAASAFALIAAGQRRLRNRALFYGTLSGEDQESGILYGAGVDHLGLDPAKVCVVIAPDEKSLLWAAEEAASCAALAASIITLPRSEKLYSFTESRRLKLRQKKSGVPLFIVRSRPRQASAATARWRVAFAKSDGLRTPGSPVPLLGRPRFRVALDRYAGLPPHQWEIEFDEAHALRVAAPVSDRPAVNAAAPPPALLL